jgi:hypothetical protein
MVVFDVSVRRLLDRGLFLSRLLCLGTVPGNGSSPAPVAAGLLFFV